MQQFILNVSLQNNKTITRNVIISMNRYNRDLWPKNEYFMVFIKVVVLICVFAAAP